MAASTSASSDASDLSPGERYLRLLKTSAPEGPRAAGRAEQASQPFGVIGSGRQTAATAATTAVHDRSHQQPVGHANQTTRIDAHRPPAPSDEEHFPALAPTTPAKYAQPSTGHAIPNLAAQLKAFHEQAAKRTPVASPLERSATPLRPLGHFPALPGAARQERQPPRIAPNWPVAGRQPVSPQQTAATVQMHQLPLADPQHFRHLGRTPETPIQASTAAWPMQQPHPEPVPTHGAAAPMQHTTAQSSVTTGPKLKLVPRKPGGWKD